jgi:hypothetical protein
MSCHTGILPRDAIRSLSPSSFRTLSTHAARVGAHHTTSLGGGEKC